ncbi:hypothetical protein [Novipirellula sp.]|uniref:hypothetical protein n=1 Tax=Novipirellula sp. TaxID=2795430 RepID=UPI00356789D6
MSRTVNETQSMLNSEKNARDDDDTGVPPSERGKEEQMSMDRRQPSFAFGIVAATYFIILILFLLAAAVFFMR